MRIYEAKDFYNLSNKAFFDKVFGIVRDISPFDLSPKVIRFITSQICLESDFGHSRLSVQSNNYIGMKRVSKRVSTQCGNDGVFGVYSDIYSSIFDLFIWYVANGLTQNHCLSVFEFETWFSSVPYCPESDYLSRIKSIFNNPKL